MVAGTSTRVQYRWRRAFQPYRSNQSTLLPMVSRSCLRSLASSWSWLLLHTRLSRPRQRQRGRQSLLVSPLEEPGTRTLLYLRGENPQNIEFHSCKPLEDNPGIACWCFFSALYIPFFKRATAVQLQRVAFLCLTDRMENLFKEPGLLEAQSQETHGHIKTELCYCIIYSVDSNQNNVKKIERMKKSGKWDKSIPDTHILYTAGQYQCSVIFPFSGRWNAILRDSKKKDACGWWGNAPALLFSSPLDVRCRSCTATRRGKSCRHSGSHIYCKCAVEQEAMTSQVIPSISNGHFVRPSWSRKQGDTLDKLLGHNRATEGDTTIHTHIQTSNNFGVPCLLYSHAFGVLEEAREFRGNPHRHKHKQVWFHPRPGIKATTFLLCGGSAIHCATLSPTYFINLFHWSHSIDPITWLPTTPRAKWRWRDEAWDALCMSGCGSSLPTVGSTYFIALDAEESRDALRPEGGPTQEAEGASVPTRRLLDVIQADREAPEDGRTDGRTQSRHKLNASRHHRHLPPPPPC